MSDYIIIFIQLFLVLIGFYLIFMGIKNINKGFGISRIIKTLKQKGE